MLDFVPTPYWIIIAVSLVLLALLLATRRPPHRVAAGLAVAVAAAVLWRLLRAPGHVEVKGEEQLPWGLIACLYIAMLAGMAAQYFFLKPDRARFRWQPFLKPFLASPVIFLPLLAGLQEHLSGGPWDIARLTLLFVAFQNGFFWKTLFDAQAGRLRAAP